MPAPEIIHQLVKHFEEHHTLYCSGKDNEAQVERMLDLHQRTSKTAQEQEMLKHEIASTDCAIDSLVYELYGLSEEEIRIVEGEKS